ncbi:unnamed protein product [Paramecium primaurelia]|uniref:Transmembrane protein n=1 Tax=Paramecium primaurelia TaxID=5886 RepID=A0A8S1P7S5_PARPR|nr:unnamed protein product [Paramecium primaurelia]
MQVAFNGYNLIYRKIITIQEDQLQQESCVAFGIWSKYTPLNILSINEEIGQFESNCFQLINIQDQTIQSLNFIYYDCLNYHTKQIVKTIMLISQHDQLFHFDNQIDPFEYENIWYNFQFISWPFQNKLQLIIIQQDKTILKEIIENVQFFNEQQLLLTQGGSFQVMESKIDLIEHGKKFHFFPGQIVSYDLLIELIPSSLDFEQYIVEEYQNLAECHCIGNEQVKIEDSDLIFLEDRIYVSNNINCDYYSLSGWFRVEDIIQKSDDFTYQFMKMSTNKFEENLSFQLFYHISPFQIKIIIKAYSLVFPIVAKDIKDSALEIEREFLFQRNTIKQWHYLVLQLFDQIINIDITFQDENGIQMYSAQINVNQFHNCQFKLRYGNIMKDSQNYLNLAIKQFYYTNCKEDDRIQKCHYSCLDCDGPNASNCLSCSIESQRIYVPQFNHCICPLPLVDYDNICVNYVDQNLQIIHQQNIYLKCQMGYFELEGECVRCPSRIRDNLITCFDCFEKQEWSQNSICLTDYYAPISFTLPSVLIPSFAVYIYDGADFILCDFCPISFDSYFVLQDEQSLYEMFLFKSIIFQKFCFINTDLDIEQRCYTCLVDYCILCRIAIDQQLCVICQKGFIEINGLCILKKKKFTLESCQLPYFASFSKICKLCTINNCLYCFEYIEDTQINTLDEMDNIFEYQEDSFKIGCMQCYDGFIFDFNLGLCIQQTPKIFNCLISYVLKFKEICIASTLENFEQSLIITKCENYIINCIKCAIDQYQSIFCIECKDKFILQDGQCYMNEEIGLNYEIQYWRPKIEAFLLIYRKKTDYTNIFLQKPSSECGLSCKSCNTSEKQYFCDECNQDYFDGSVRIQHGFYCFECPRLCQVCRTRSFENIKIVNPLFQIRQENAIYTQECIQPKFDPFIFYDPYLKTTQYCFDGNCQNGFQLEYWQYNCFLERFPQNLTLFNINTEYCNQLGIQTFEFSINFEIYSEHCYYNKPLLTRATLKEEVFTLKTVNLKITSFNQFSFVAVNTMEFYQYDSISMINTEFIFQENSRNNIMLLNEYNLVDLTLINFTIKDSGIVNITSLFYAQQFGTINIQNLSIINTTIRNSSLIQLLKFEGQMTIKTLYFFNCTFIDSILFFLSNSIGKIQIENLILDSCECYNASFYTLFINYMQESTFQMKNFLIKSNIFLNSNFLFCSQIIKIDLIDLIVKSNHFYNSLLFGFSYSLSANNIKITDNLFMESSFLQTIQVNNDKYTHVDMYELLLQDNIIQNTNIFNIFSNSYSNNLNINVQKVHIEQNIRSIKTNEESSIFSINCLKLYLKNFFIRNNQQILMINLYDIQEIELSNLFFFNSAVQQKVFLSKNCFKKSNLQNQLIFIKGFDRISIENCTITNQSSIDESLIEILSSKSKQLMGQIFINKVKFYGNLLQQLNQIQSFSLLTIVSDRNIEIVIEDVEYKNNFMHVYSESSLKQSATLLYISSALSNIFVNNLDCIQNSMTNSSNSFIMIRSKVLKFNNIQIKKQNILPYNIWRDYYPIQIENEDDQEEINLFIIQIYQIKTIGGVAFIEASSFTSLNCSFQEILASASSVFDIVTLNDGMIMISNLSVNSTRYSLEQVESSGCITVNSQNSLLNFSISLALFSNVINKLSTSVFSILPSLLINRIMIQDVQIFNCISLKNQIIHIQFINQIVALNTISLINIKIIQNQQEWETYFQMIGLLTLSEILQITSDDNSLIYLENCDLYIKDFTIEGMLISPILNLINLQQLNIINFNVENIKNVKTQNLIQIIQTIQTKSTIHLKQLNIQKGHLFNLHTYLKVKSKIFQFDYYKVGCVIMNNSLKFEQPQDYFLNNIIQLEQSNYQHSAIIHIISKTNLSNIYLEMIEIKNNTYLTSLQGIIYFDIVLFKHLRIFKLNCNQNFINEYGCLNFVGNNSVKSKIQIKNSNFINNNGTKGVAIKVINVSLDIKNCKITSNLATTQGGGLYLSLTQNIFRIENTQILYNKAQEGGGIYFDKDYNLNSKNFHKSYLQFNQATIYGNNLVESPTHLTLFINSKKIPDEQQIKDNISTSFLKIKPYKTIEQGKSIYTKQLIIPSNQEINSYQLFIPKRFYYQSYIKNMSLYFQNSKGELLYKQLNSTCNVSSNIIKLDGSEVITQRINNILQYQSDNNNFELGTLAFKLDPYESEYDYLKIYVQCRTYYSKNVFNYIMNTRSLKCQLGEFHIDNGCQICVWSQGFYSVTYNSIKCSIYDKLKFQNITSNMINLYEGYWRPNYLSDYTESCYKSPGFCKGGWEVGDNSCSLGRKGALCEMCDIYDERGEGRFFKNQEDLKCSSCSQHDNIILPFLFALFQVLLSIILSLKSINRSNQLFTSLRIFEKFSKIIFKLNQDHEGILVKMLLNYLWIFSIIFTFNINFTFSVIFIEQSSNSFYFMVNNLDCYLSNLQTELIYIKIIVILIMMLLQFNLILAFSFLYHSITKNKMDNSILSNTLLCLYLFNYGGLIKMYCSLLSSRQISNIIYIQGDVSLLYDTKNHQQWIYFIIIPLLLVFGCIIPFSLFLLTYIKRDSLNKIKLRKHICYLFNEYTDSNYYWEQIKLIQKAMIILITTYFENSILLKISLIGLCLLTYQAITVKNKPYIISKFNNLDLSSGQICSITIFLAAVKYESQNLNNTTISTFLQIVLLILMVRLCYPFIYNIFTVYYKKYSYAIFLKIHSLLQHLKINTQFTQRFGNYLLRKNERQTKLKMNFLKLREYFLPKHRNQNKMFKFAHKKSHLKSNTNSGKYLIEVTNE